MFIGALRKSLYTIKEENMIKLLSDVIFENIDEIRDFDSNETYYRGMFVYKYDDVLQKHNIYQCNTDVFKGEFDLTKWIKWMMNSEHTITALRLLQSSYTASSDNETQCPINEPSFDQNTDYIIVLHDVLGILNNSHYSISNDNLYINLNGVVLDTNKSLKYLIFKNVLSNTNLDEILSNLNSRIDSINSLANAAVPSSGGIMTGFLTLNNDPTEARHAVTKQYVDNLLQGLDIKDSVRVATTENIILSGLQTIDDVLININDRILVKNQTNAIENGIYIAKEGVWERSPDFDDQPDNEITGGEFTFVKEGTINADNGYVVISNPPITIGTSPITFTQFNGAGQLIPGNGLILNGNEMSIGEGNGIQVNNDTIEVKLDGGTIIKSQYGLKVNTGHGNGLDADTLDGYHASSFVRSDIPQNILSASGIKGSATGTANTSYFNFYEADGSTAQGWIGFGSTNNNTLTIKNYIPDANVDLVTTGVGKATVNGNDIWHKGNDGSLVKNNIVQTLWWGSGIQGNGSGVNTYSLLAFYDNDKTTRRGLVGKANNTNNNVYFMNETSGGHIVLGTSGGGKFYCNNEEIQTKPTTTNTFFGYSAGGIGTGPYNTGTGHSALFGLTTGYSNTSIGHGSLQFLKTGSGNIGMGVNAGRYTPSLVENSSSTRCVFIGTESTVSANGAENEIVIGYSASGKGSNTAHIGNSSVASISFGAGTGTAFTNRSDRRTKEDIQDADLTICYDTIKNLPLRRFKYKDFIGNTGDQHLTGFISDEFEQYFPKAVFKNIQSFPVLDENGNKVMKTIVDTNGTEREVEETFVIEDCASIDTSQIVVTLYGAVQKLIEKVEFLESEIQLLKQV